MTPSTKAIERAIASITSVKKVRARLPEPCARRPPDGERPDRAVAEVASELVEEGDPGVRSPTIAQSAGPEP